VIGDDCNIQDSVVIHALGGTGVRIGPVTSVAHDAIIYGPCQIARGYFVGFNSVVFGATLGEGSVVMHHGLVEAVSVPGHLHIASMTAVRSQDDVKDLPAVTPDIAAFVNKVRQTNLCLVEA